VLTSGSYMGSMSRICRCPNCYKDFASGICGDRHEKRGIAMGPLRCNAPGQETRESARHLAAGGYCLAVEQLGARHGGTYWDTGFNLSPFANARRHAEIAAH
jgi:hypothetical protein